MTIVLGAVGSLAFLALTLGAYQGFRTLKRALEGLQSPPTPVVPPMHPLLEEVYPRVKAMEAEMLAFRSWVETEVKKAKSDYGSARATLSKARTLAELDDDEGDAEQVDAFQSRDAAGGNSEGVLPMRESMGRSITVAQQVRQEIARRIIG